MKENKKRFFNRVRSFFLMWFLLKSEAHDLVKAMWQAIIFSVCSVKEVKKKLSYNNG